MTQDELYAKYKYYGFDENVVTLGIMKSVYDKETIRAYVQQPQLDSSSQYVDFYINSHYLQKTGTQTWGQWNSS